MFDGYNYKIKFFSKSIQMKLEIGSINTDIYIYSIQIYIHDIIIMEWKFTVGFMCDKNWYMSLSCWILSGLILWCWPTSSGACLLRQFYIYVVERINLAIQLQDGKSGSY